MSNAIAHVTAETTRSGRRNLLVIPSESPGFRAWSGGMVAAPIPTGYLFMDQYERGMLETLSIGDYGKKYNVKANFLGIDRPICGVPNVECMPLQEKWVVTISTQYGCPMRCTFCDVPNLKFNGNASVQDMYSQLLSALSLFPEVKYTERLNLHFARMGEPILNPAVLEFAEFLAVHKRRVQEDSGVRIEVLHPVLTTSSPKNFKNYERHLMKWCQIKNDIYNGQAGLQLSINSTNEDQRSAMYNGMQRTLEEIAEVMSKAPDPLSRKYCLNFAFATGNEANGGKLASLFPPDRFMVKITPIHNNNACRENGISTAGGYDSFEPYQEAEANFMAAGFDVLTFVPSMDEENGLVTCGNLVLGGSVVKNTEGVIKIQGIVR